MSDPLVTSVKMCSPGTMVKNYLKYVSAYIIKSELVFPVKFNGESGHVTNFQNRLSGPCGMTIFGKRSSQNNQQKNHTQLCPLILSLHFNKTYTFVKFLPIPFE